MFSYTPAHTASPTIPQSLHNNKKEEKEGKEGTVTLEQLFNYGRIKKDAPLLHKLLFLCYLPFGLIILITRILLFLVVLVSILLLPRSVGDVINMPLMRMVCGLVVRHNNKNRNKPLLNEPHIVAGNHVADFDTFAMWVVLPKFHTLTAAHLQTIPIIGRAYTRLNAIFVTPTPEGRAKVKATVHEVLAKDPAPVLIFPEGGLTSGKKGTMLYNKFVFSLDCSIVPLAIQLNDPWPVNHDYLGSTWTRNFLWFLLVPFHIFDMTLLPAERRNEGELPEEFAARVQKITCDFLDIEATSHPYSQKKELGKLIASGKVKNM